MINQQYDAAIVQFSNGQIPMDRPVLGVDLKIIQGLLGLSVDDARWLFGVSLPGWYAYTRRQNNVNKHAGKREQLFDDDTNAGENVTKGPDEPVNESLALLIRFFDVMEKYVYEVGMPRATVHDLSKCMKGVCLRELSELLGRDQSASHRWFKEDARPHPTVARLIDCLVRWLSDKDDENGMLPKVEAWRNLVIREYQLRQQLEARRSMRNGCVNSEKRQSVCMGGDVVV